MQDVFLSYAHEDRDRARVLVDALEGQGFSVWWDREIDPGQNWLRAIEDRVRQAQCVIVLWTRHSVASDWVREEASLARDQGKLLPVLLEDSEVPLSFRLIQAADLRGWDGRLDHPEFQELVRGARACVDRAGAQGSPATIKQAHEPSDTRAFRARLRQLVWLLLPSLIVALAVLALMNWHVPATVEVDVVATRLDFRTQGRDPQVLLNSASVRSLALRRFQEVRLSAASAWIADPAKYDLARDIYPEAAWRPLPPEQISVLRPVDKAATLTIQPVTEAAGSLVVDRIFAGLTRVTLQSPEKGSLQINLRGGQQNGAVALPDEFLVVADRCTGKDGAFPFPGPSVALRVRLGRDSRLLEFTAGESGLLLALEFPPNRKDPFLAKTGIPIDEVQFLDQGATGRPESTLSGPGAIRYDTPPGAQPVALKANEYLYIKDLRRFRLLEVAPAEQEGNLRIRLQGTAGKLASGSPGFVRDRRLTQFDRLWHSPTLAALFTILVWLIPTVLAARRFFKDLHR